MANQKSNSQPGRMGQQPTGRQSSAQELSGQAKDKNESRYGNPNPGVKGRPTGETPATNRGFSQVERGDEAESTQRVGRVPHRQDPSSINQESGGGMSNDTRANQPPKDTDNRH